MPTIAELVAAHSKVPGDIRITRWGHAFWYQPVYQIDGNWYGPTQQNPCEAYPNSDQPNGGGWHLYPEPRPKVKRAQYLIEEKGKYPALSTMLFSDLKEAEFCYGGVTLTRLMETEREFDE